MKFFTATSLLTCPGLCWWAYSSQTLEPPSDGNMECKRGWQQWWPGSQKGSQRSHFGLGSCNGPDRRNVWKGSDRGICSWHPIPTITPRYSSHHPNLNNLKQLEWSQGGHEKPSFKFLSIVGSRTLTQSEMCPTCWNVDDCLKLQ